MFVTGCGSDKRVNTVSVLANPNCKGVSEGLTEVTLADVARFRGSQLVVPETTATDQTPVASSNAASEPMPLLIALSRGPQPSRGFELHLANQARVVAPTQLALELYWSEPDTSKPQPLVTTNPCLVVSVPTGPWEQISATDQHGNLLGTLNRAPTSANN